MKKPFFALFFAGFALLLVACVPPSHPIRINESLPKNAPIEKQSVVVYVQDDGLKGDTPLKDKDILGSHTIYSEGLRQIEFWRTDKITCDPIKLGNSSRFVYYVVWYKEGEAYQTLKAYCDEKSEKFRAFLVYNKQNRTQELSVSTEYSEWVIEVK